MLKPDGISKVENVEAPRSPKLTEVITSSKRTRTEVDVMELSHDIFGKKLKTTTEVAYLPQTLSHAHIVTLSSSIKSSFLAITKKVLEPGSPMAYLQSIVSSEKATLPGAFTKPTEDQLAAYDVQVVTAIRNSDIDKLKQLHRDGKPMNACNQFGESLFHMVCRRGHVAMVKFMLSCKDVKVDVRDDFGRTPLHDACWTTTPNFEVMEILLNASGIELLLAEDVRGHSPFCYARREHWSMWVDFLSKYNDKLTRNHHKQVVA